MNIKALREEKNLTQEELSSQTGIPRARISKWEAGKGNPKADDAKILENFFSIATKNQAMQENQSQKSEGNVLTSDETYRSLVRTMEHMSEDKIRTTALLERMMNIIENAFNSVEPRKAPSVPVVSDTPEGDQAKPIDLSLDKKYFGTEKEGRPSKKDK